LPTKRSLDSLTTDAKRESQLSDLQNIGLTNSFIGRIGTRGAKVTRLVLGQNGKQVATNNHRKTYFFKYLFYSQNSGSKSGGLHTWRVGSRTIFKSGSQNATKLFGADPQIFDT